MNLQEFKNKHRDLIEMGVVTFYETKQVDFIVVDRFVDDQKILCSSNEAGKASADARKMGYTLRQAGIGHYGKNKEGIKVPTLMDTVTNYTAKIYDEVFDKYISSSPEEFIKWVLDKSKSCR